MSGFWPDLQIPAGTWGPTKPWCTTSTATTTHFVSRPNTTTTAAHTAGSTSKATTSATHAAGPASRKGSTLAQDALVHLHLAAVENRFKARS